MVQSMDSYHRTPMAVQPSKPLHVLVAEAMGWISCRYETQQWDGAPSSHHWIGGCPTLPTLAGVMQRCAIPALDTPACWREVAAEAARLGLIPDIVALCELIVEREK